MQQPDFAQAARYAYQRLAQELDPRLRYHSLAHTRDDVLPALERLAEREGLSGEPLLLLRTAAAYHDIGFLINRADHEAAGADLARAVLPGFGYSAAQAEQIAELILSTRMPQSPTSKLAEFLADADLDLLGRPDFIALNGVLLAERRSFGDEVPETDWYRNQVSFLASHRYWTVAARDLRDAGKAENLRLLRERLAASEGNGAGPG